MSDPASWTEQPKGQFGGGTPLPPEAQRYTHGMREQFTSEWNRRGFDFHSIDTALEDTQDWKAADYFAQQLTKPQGKPFFFACGIFRPTCHGMCLRNPTTDWPYAVVTTIGYGHHSGDK